MAHSPGVQVACFNAALAKIVAGAPPGGGRPPQENLRENDATAVQTAGIRDARKRQPMGRADRPYNRELMARTIGPNEGGIERKNTGKSCKRFLRSLASTGIASGELKDRDGHTIADVFVKVLFAYSTDAIGDYCRTGAWSGPNCKDDIVNGGYLANFAPRGNPYYWSRHWDKCPKVDRSKVKIARFDYFGHSDRTTLALEYGMMNDKGEYPSFEWKVEARHMKKWFGGGVVDADAIAVLWGCNLGRPHQDENEDSRIGEGEKSLGPWLAEKGYFAEVIAADKETTFVDVVKKGHMPKPDDGGKWVPFKRRRP